MKKSCLTLIKYCIESKQCYHLCSVPREICIWCNVSPLTLSLFLLTNFSHISSKLMSNAKYFWLSIDTKRVTGLTVREGCFYVNPKRQLQNKNLQFRDIIRII